MTPNKPHQPHEAPDPDEDSAPHVSVEGLKVDLERLKGSPLAAQGAADDDDAQIVLTEAYCHRGHPLITPDNPTFDGHPGVRVLVRVGEGEQTIVLSPIHGDHRRVGGADLAAGTRCSVRCPTCGEELIGYAPCPCGEGTLRSVFLTPDLREAHVAALCDVWGCQRSRIVDEWEILSEFVQAEVGP